MKLSHTTAAALGLIMNTALAANANQPDVSPRVVADVLLRGGVVVDGTGAARFQGDVALRGDRIVAVGSSALVDARRVIDVAGHIVAPGFIDLHTHSDETLLEPGNRPNRNYTTQGVTTVVTGNCGLGAIDAGAFLDAVARGGAGSNVIHLIPLGAVRAEVMGNADRKPSTAETARMRRIVARGLDAGAWGVSTGLIYVPGRYASTSEIVDLAAIAGRRGGIYASHIRDEEAKLLESIDEAITIGREAKMPAHISHLKANLKANWGMSRAACAHIEAARAAGQAVTADQYPYSASSTRLGAMVTPPWSQNDGPAGFARLADDPVAGPKLRAAIQHELDIRDAGAALRIARFPARTSRVGKDLVAIAREEGTTPLEIVLDIERRGGAQSISFGMSEDDVRQIMRHDYVATASDGAAHRPGRGDRPHPRAYGTFPHKIRLALDSELLTLEQVVRSCSGLPAKILHLRDRGVIRVGNRADLVVFDPAAVRDLATYDNPTRYSTGIAYVYVNGTPVVEASRATDALPGRALRLPIDGPTAPPANSSAPHPSSPAALK